MVVADVRGVAKIKKKLPLVFPVSLFGRLSELPVHSSQLYGLLPLQSFPRLVYSCGLLFQQDRWRFVLCIHSKYILLELLRVLRKLWTLLRFLILFPGHVGHAVLRLSFGLFRWCRFELLLKRGDPCLFLQELVTWLVLACCSWNFAGLSLNLG